MIHAQSNYDAIISAFADPNIRSIGLEGGSRSGKSFDVCIFILQYTLKYRNKHIVIARDSKATLNSTTYKTLQDVYALAGVPVRWPKFATLMKIQGNTIDFVQMNDGDTKAQGLESDLLWVNEADLCDMATFDQLEQRNKDFIILDYNPRHVENWVYDREKLPHHAMHFTTVLDNKFAPKAAKAKILSYEPTPENIERGTANEYYWNVYGLGQRAAGDAYIFTNIKRYNDNTAPASGQIEWQLIGGDFGYSHDPTAIVLVTKAGNNIYVKELVYETGWLNKDIATYLRQNNYHYTHLSIWDSAEPKSIDDLKASGIGCHPASKGPGSVAFGIGKLQEFNLYIHQDSENAYNEFVGCQWAKDRKGNYKLNMLNQRVPVSGNDHTIDATRYAVMHYFNPYNPNND